jgi:Tol biopolymer transport system component/DNA-binding winged helix-turn-helix (wHTH) protein
MNAVGNLVHTSPRLRIDQCVVDLGTHRIFRGEHIARMSPKSVAVLRCLLAHAGQTITRDQLIDEVWNSQHASDELLTQAIKELRRAFNDDPKTPQYIETIPKGGYRLMAKVEEEALAPPVVARVADLLKTASNEGKPDVTNDRGALQTRPRTGPPLGAGAYVIAALLVLIAATAILISRWPAASSAKIDLPTQTITSGYDRVEFPSISPDGTLIVYSAQHPGETDSHLYIQTENGSSPLLLEAGQGATSTYPVWSPSGTSIAFLRIDERGCMVHIIAATGGESRPVASCYKDTMSYFDWSPDGQYLITQATAGSTNKEHWALMTVRIADGHQHELDYVRDIHSDDLSPHYSPDGQWIAFRRGANPFSDIFLVNASGKQLRRLTNIRAAIAGFAWTSNSKNIVFSSNYQNATRLYLLNVENGNITATNLDDTAFPSIGAKSNRLTAVRDRTTVNISEFSMDATQPAVKPLPSRSPSGAIDNWPQYSARENQLCFVSDRSGSWQLWLSKSDTGPATMLTEFNQNETLSNPQWAADDKHVLFISQSQRRSRLLSIDIVSHQVHEMIPSGENIRVASYAPDGKSLDIVSDRSGPWQLWRFAPASGKYTLLLDGPVIAFGHGPNEEIYYTLASMPGLYRTHGDKGELVSGEINSANRLAWQVSKSGIFFIRFEDNKLTALHLLRWSDEASSTLSTLTNFGAEMPIAVSPDESRMAVPIAAHSASAIIVSSLADHVR